MRSSSWATAPWITPFNGYSRSGVRHLVSRRIGGGRQNISNSSVRFAFIPAIRLRSRSVFGLKNQEGTEGKPERLRIPSRCDGSTTWHCARGCDASRAGSGAKAALSVSDHRECRPNAVLMPSECRPNPVLIPSVLSGGQNTMRPKGGQPHPFLLNVSVLSRTAGQARSRAQNEFVVVPRLPDCPSPRPLPPRLPNPSLPLRQG
jgi:hypothetical protein